MYRKTENEIKIWLFFTWFYSLKLFISVVFGYGAIDRCYRSV